MERALLGKRETDGGKLDERGDFFIFFFQNIIKIFVNLWQILIIILYSVFE
jgi:hypothetical protein